MDRHADKSARDDRGESNDREWEKNERFTIRILRVLVSLALKSKKADSMDRHADKSARDDRGESNDREWEKNEQRKKPRFLTKHAGGRIFDEKL